MSHVPDNILPFYIPEGPEGVGSVVYTDAPSIGRPAKLELHVIAGGPVFLWRGRMDLKTAYNQTHGADPNPDFDLASSGSAEVYVGEHIGQLTLHADVETIGYIRITKETM